ncbi:TadE family type IV pilus minor pilin [Microbacterium sp. G2-8]|uniref:TadE family type IV pilus minor pilin n=1 Tax=Microbacterium sp. G2-8 TaxID=2842454 RepID=UPI001C8A757E|nr:TadE family type IV pilus minor pilin [Microbacterium sp. G2-8]
MTTRHPLGDRGSASAEFAVALPALILVILLGVGALLASSTHVRLQDAAADAARLAARGEPDRAASVIEHAVAGATSSLSDEGDLICVSAAIEVGVGSARVPLSATSCALAGGL